MIRSGLNPVMTNANDGSAAGDSSTGRLVRDQCQL